MSAPASCSRRKADNTAPACAWGSYGGEDLLRLAPRTDLRRLGFASSDGGKLLADDLELMSLGTMRSRKSHRRPSCLRCWWHRMANVLAALPKSAHSWSNDPTHQEVINSSRETPIHRSLTIPPASLLRRDSRYEPAQAP